MILIVFLVLSLVLNIVLGLFIFFVLRFLRTAEELLAMLYDDVETNVKYFDKLLTTPLFDNSQEVKIANRNMSIMRKRLQEYAFRIEENVFGVEIEEENKEEE